MFSEVFDLKPMSWSTGKIRFLPAKGAKIHQNNRCLLKTRFCVFAVLRGLDTYMTIVLIHSALIERRYRNRAARRSLALQKTSLQIDGALE